MLVTLGATCASSVRAGVDPLRRELGLAEGTSMEEVVGEAVGQLEIPPGKTEGFAIEQKLKACLIATGLDGTRVPATGCVAQLTPHALQLHNSQLEALALTYKVQELPSCDGLRLFRVWYCGPAERRESNTPLKCPTRRRIRTVKEIMQDGVKQLTCSCGFPSTHCQPCR